MAKAKPVLDECGDFPEADAIRRRMAYLESITRRVDSDQQRIDEPLKRLFGDALVADLWMVKLSDGRRYYLKDKPTLAAAGPAAIDTIGGTDLASKRVGIDASKVAFNDVAPQVGLAKSVRPLLKDLNDTNWEATFARIAKAIDESHDIDPILKVILMRETLETGSRGSTLFEKKFSKHVDKLAEQNVNPLANWLDPKDEDAVNQRRRAELALLGFPDVAAAAAETEKELTALRRPPGRSAAGSVGCGAGQPASGAASRRRWASSPANFLSSSARVRRGAAFDRVGTVKEGMARLRNPRRQRQHGRKPLVPRCPVRRASRCRSIARSRYSWTTSFSSAFAAACSGRTTARSCNRSRVAGS